MDDLSVGWQKYLESLDKNIGSLEKRLGNIERDVREVREYKRELMGKTAVGAFFVGIALQLIIAYFGARFK